MNFKSCVACKSQLTLDATICPTCRSYQSRWKAQFQYYATIAGLITLVFYVIVYVLSALPDLRRTLFWRDGVAVTAFGSMYRIVVFNFGNGEVFVSHLSLSSKNPRFLKLIPIDKAIKSKSFLVHELKDENWDMQAWPFKALTEAQWQTALNVNDNPCFMLGFVY